MKKIKRIYFFDSIPEYDKGYKQKLIEEGEKSKHSFVN